MVIHGPWRTHDSVSRPDTVVQQQLAREEDEVRTKAKALGLVVLTEAQWQRLVGDRVAELRAFAETQGMLLIDNAEQQALIKELRGLNLSTLDEQLQYLKDLAKAVETLSALRKDINKLMSRLVDKEKKPIPLRSMSVRAVPESLNLS